MVKAWMKLEGFEEYLDELMKAGQDIDAVAEECLAAGSDVLVSGMLRRAPNSERVRNLIRKTAIMKDGSKRYLYLGVLRGQDAEAVRLANVFEFGGRADPSPKDRSRKNRPGFKIHSFIRPTLRNDAKKAKNAMINIFQDWLKK